MCFVFASQGIAANRLGQDTPLMFVSFSVRTSVQTPTPPPPPQAAPAPPPPPPTVATSHSRPTSPPTSKGRGALLDSISGFSKGKLKKAETNDRSAPKV